jgi:hypothetical protein
MKRIFLLIALLGMNGCTVHRDLRLTEVGPDQVELYLNEVAQNRLDLTGHVLEFRHSDGTTGQIPLSGTMAGGEFLVIWEDSNHRGTPSAAPYTGGQLRSVPGIKVGRNTLPDYQTSLQPTEAGAYRVSGTHRRGWVTDKTDDVLKCGSPTTRPTLPGGTFHEDGSLNTVVPQGSFPLSRRWSNGSLVDTDSESDWKRFAPNLGVPTP